MYRSLPSSHRTRIGCNWPLTLSGFGEPAEGLRIEFFPGLVGIGRDLLQGDLDRVLALGHALPSGRRRGPA